MVILIIEHWNVFFSISIALDNLKFHLNKIIKVQCLGILTETFFYEKRINRIVNQQCNRDKNAS